MSRNIHISVYCVFVSCFSLSLSPADETLLTNVACGVVSGVISSSIANPTDVLKVRTHTRHAHTYCILAKQVGKEEAGRSFIHRIKQMLQADITLAHTIHTHTHTHTHTESCTNMQVSECREGDGKIRPECQHANIKVIEHIEDLNLLIGFLLIE